nr:3-dehydroquinate synthase [Caulobacter sp. 17J80-11]
MVGAGLIASAGQLIRPLARGGRAAVVADETVAGLYGSAIVQALADAGLRVSLVTVPPGEGSKSFAELERLCDRLLGLGLDRKDLIVAVGGGVIGDLAGFAAAIYMRGIDVVQIPTSLLAQVDSSVGGKTAIDTPRGKNLIGAFWQPRLVLADLDVLATLPERELKAGWAEVVKYGLLGDADFFARLEADGIGGDLAHAVARSVEMKAEIVAEDPRETGRRALLNLGHTFAHALEAEAGFDGSLLHGEAVAIGMAQAFRLSARLGLCPEADARRAEAALAAAGLPTTMAEVKGAPFAAERLIDHMARDKKAEAGQLVLVLARGIGDAFVARGVDRAAVRDFLIAEGARP